MTSAEGVLGFGKCATCDKDGQFTFHKRPPPQLLRLDIEMGRDSEQRLCAHCHSENRLRLVREANAQKDQGDPLLRVQPRKKGERPRMVICAICGKQYTFASLVQHEKTCVEMWEREQADLPKKMRAKKMPTLASATMRRAQQMVEEQEAVGEGSGDDHEARFQAAMARALEEATEQAWQESQEALTECPNGCGRTFSSADAISSHLKGCIKTKGDQVFDKKVRKKFGLSGPPPTPHPPAEAGQGGKESGGEPSGALMSEQRLQEACEVGASGLSQDLENVLGAAGLLGDTVLLEGLRKLGLTTQALVEACPDEDMKEAGINDFRRRRLLSALGVASRSSSALRESRAKAKAKANEIAMARPDAESSALNQERKIDALGQGEAGPKGEEDETAATLAKAKKDYAARMRKKRAQEAKKKQDGGGGEGPTASAGGSRFMAPTAASQKHSEKAHEAATAAKHKNEQGSSRLVGSKGAGADRAAAASASANSSSSNPPPKREKKERGNFMSATGSSKARSVR